MKEIDIKTWNRKEHFEFFYNKDCPQYGITANVDITEFLKFVKANKLSFYYSMIYAVTYAANKVQNFRYRIHKGTVVEYEQVHPSFTDMDSGDTLFKIINAQMKESLFEFVAYAKEKSHKQKKYFDYTELDKTDDALYISTVPWLTFTQLNHVTEQDRDDAVPRITWGKYFEDKNRILMPIAIHVNHALIDGIHIAQYIESLENYLKDKELWK